MASKKRKGQSYAYWVYHAPGSFDAFVCRTPDDWEPPGREFKGPFWRAKFARAYGRTICYGEVAKARSKAWSFKRGAIVKDFPRTKIEMAPQTKPQKNLRK